MTSDREAQAARLSAITQRIGFAVWQLQELEWTTATYVVIKRHAQRGIGADRGAELLDAAGKRTFGSLLKELADSGILDPGVAERLNSALGERNWLVHRSRRDNRGVLASDERCAALVAKLERLSNEALALLKYIGQLIEQHALQSGVSEGLIERESERLLVQWGILK